MKQKQSRQGPGKRTKDFALQIMLTDECEELIAVFVTMANNVKNRK